MSDNGEAIEAAIAAADQPTVAMAQLQVTIASTGRPFAMTFPADMTDAELVEVTGWMLTSVVGSLRAERARRSSGRLIIPRSLP